MKTGIFKLLINLGIITLGVLIMLVTSMLLNLYFFKEHLVRQLIVYVVMAVELFVTYRIIYLLNRNESWMKNNTR